MASVTITIPDAQVTRVVNALCNAGGYPTRNAANAKAALMDFIKQTVINQERAAAEAAAVAAIPTPAEPGLT